MNSNHCLLPFSQNSIQCATIRRCILVYFIYNIEQLCIQGDRGEYILKLTELERKMESFHRIMADRLGPAAMQVYEDAELASNAVSALLAPYRDEMAGN